jgi:hypothetical protein
MDSVPILKHNNEKDQQKTTKKGVNVCSSNIRRGLLIREEELKSIIKSNSLDVIFLVETDTNSVNSETDYKILGFRTLIQMKESSNDLTRVVCLIDEKMSHYVIIRSDLSSKDFPSLWIEMENACGKNILCGGFYREWAPKGVKSIDAQVKSMQKFTSKIEFVGCCHATHCLF